MSCLIGVSGGLLPRGLPPFSQGWNSAELGTDRLASSCALNSSSVTAAPCIVDLQVCGLRVGEKSLEHHRSLSAFTDFGIDHHVLRVEGADSQKARRKYFWDGVNSLEGSIGDLAHVDSMARAIRRICRLVLEIDKEKFLAKFRMLHAHAA